MIIQLVHLIALTFLIGILILISVSEARGVFTAYVQSMVLSEGKIRECQGPVAGLSLTIVTTPCNSKKQSIVIIADRTPPRIQVPNHNLIVANATNARGSVVDYKVSATDNVATNIHPICQPIASGQVFPIGNTTIVCTAKDNNNNTAKASFVVVVKNKEVLSTRPNGLILSIILLIIAGVIAAAILIYRRSRQRKYSV